MHARTFELIRASLFLPLSPSFLRTLTHTEERERGRKKRNNECMRRSDAPGLSPYHRAWPYVIYRTRRLAAREVMRDFIELFLCLTKIIIVLLNI